MLSTNAETLMFHLGQQVDPLTSAEIAEQLDMTRREAVEAINELKSIGRITESAAGYKLLGEDEEPEQAVQQGQNNFEKVLFMLAVSRKRQFPLSVAKLLNMTNRDVSVVLAQLNDAQIVECRSPGSYYLTLSGLDFIANNYPALEVPGYVRSNVRNPPSAFRVSKPRRKGMLHLPDIDQKIAALKPLIEQSAPEHKQHLRDLLTRMEAAA